MNVVSKTTEQCQDDTINPNESIRTNLMNGGHLHNFHATATWIPLPACKVRKEIQFDIIGRVPVWIVCLHQTYWITYVQDLHEEIVLAHATANRPLPNGSYSGSQWLSQSHPPKMQKRSLVALSWTGIHHLILKHVGKEKSSPLGAVDLLICRRIQHHQHQRDHGAKSPESVCPDIAPWTAVSIQTCLLEDKSR